MEKIQEIWFENERIFMQSVSGKVFSRPLEAYPILKDADYVQRQKFYIWGNGEYVRWKDLEYLPVTVWTVTGSDFNIDTWLPDREIISQNF